MGFGTGTGRAGLWAGIAAALAVATPAAALQPLEHFLASARSANPDELENRANLAQQSAQSEAGLGRLLPGISASGSYIRNQYQSQVGLPAPGGTQLITITPYDQLQGAATLTVPLVNLANQRRLSSARSSEEGAARQLEATRLLVQGEVVQDYYQLVANLALVAASQQALAVSRESLRLAQARFEAGAAPVLDVDRARADVESQAQQVAAAELQVALSARALESVSGAAPAASGVVPLEDDLHPEPELARFQAGFDGLPAVASARLATRAAEQQAEAQRLALLPSLAGSFTENGTNASGFVGHDWSFQAVVTLSWTFDLTSIANIRGQDAAAEAARARELRARLAAADAIHREWNTVTAGIARSRSARAGREAAAHASEQARDRYQAGTTTQLELLQAQRDAFSAEVARIQADADLVNARKQLRLSAGESLLPAGEGKGQGTP
jgi:outer membrane protein TolC